MVPQSPFVFPPELFLRMFPHALLADVLRAFPCIPAHIHDISIAHAPYSMALPQSLITASFGTACMLHTWPSMYTIFATLW